MKAGPFETNKVLFQQSYGAHFRVILSLFPIINLFSQEVSSLTLSLFSSKQKRGFSVYLQRKNGSNVKKCVLMHQVSFSRIEFNIYINLLKTYLILFPHNLHLQKNQVNHSVFLLVAILKKYLFSAQVRKQKGAEKIYKINISLINYKRTIQITSTVK